jgi:hypothetical protein
MLFQIHGHGWPCDGGRLYLAEGTICDTSEPGMAAIFARNGSVPPPNAVPLDQAALDAMQKAYPPHSIKRFGPVTPSTNERSSENGYPQKRTPPRRRTSQQTNSP